jgi:hypothetical protein
MFNNVINNFTMPGGCSDQILQCRALQAESDPGDAGTNSTVNDVCAVALEWCSDNVLQTFSTFTTVFCTPYLVDIVETCLQSLAKPI